MKVYKIHEVQAIDKDCGMKWIESARLKVRPVLPTFCLTIEGPDFYLDWFYENLMHTHRSS